MIEGTVYLIHFDRPYKHAAHYVGWTTNLEARLEEHRKGSGARLMEVLKEAGIGWKLAKSWPGTRELERRIKRQGGAARCCPACVAAPRLSGFGTVHLSRPKAGLQFSEPRWITPENRTPDDTAAEKVLDAMESASRAADTFGIYMGGTK